MRWYFHQEDSKTQKNGEKLWYLDTEMDLGFEMEIQQTDGGKYVVYLYKATSNKPQRKRGYNTLTEAKAMGVLWLLDAGKSRLAGLVKMFLKLDAQHNDALKAKLSKAD
jgi:hypothetical protein